MLWPCVIVIVVCHHVVRAAIVVAMWTTPSHHNKERSSLGRHFVHVWQVMEGLWQLILMYKCTLLLVQRAVEANDGYKLGQSLVSILLYAHVQCVSPEG